jgi:hypothetical protein
MIARSRQPLLAHARRLALAGSCALALTTATAHAALRAEFLAEHCLDCHDAEISKGNLNLESLLNKPLQNDTEIWEKVVRRLRGRQMPPADRKRRPTEAEYVHILHDLESDLAALARERPRPGRVETLRRLNRTEYQNAIRDLLHLDIDAAKLLPADDSSHGFDNITVGELSPTLLTRYIAAAQKIARLAVGSRTSPDGATFRVPPDKTQEQRVPGLPIGTRGGALIPYNFPADGEYEIQVHLTRDRNEKVEGLNGSQQLEILLDRKRVENFTVKPPKNGRDHTKVDANLKTRIRVAAGPHDLGVTFVAKPYALIETKRQPYLSRYNYHRHPRQSPAVFQVSITGPFSAEAPTRPVGAASTPAQMRIWGGFPAGGDKSGGSFAREILARIARRAFRRPVTDADLERPLQFFRETYKGTSGEGFHQGIEAALSAILVSPQFLFRIENEPANAKPGTVFQLSDLQLATRLSFFLWSSIPDDQLLNVAEAGNLNEPAELKRQVLRMLADPKSAALVDNFANQWLYLRNLGSITPNHRLFPDFDDNLRQAFKRETELFFANVLNKDRPVTDLLKADYTFLNERLARHYGIPRIHGSRFRKVALNADDHRGGLLRHGSILTVTSYATRTSPVIRGDWVMKNILGIHLPPPPPNVPELEENSVDANLPFRERFKEHRANKSCAVCHDMIDPIGFALENYDAIGRWRAQESGRPIDAAGALPDGSRFDGVAGLERRLLERPEIFAAAFTEKLLTFALGRGLEGFDGPAVRTILTDAARDDYRMSAIILGIANSVPFRMKEIP